MLSIRSQSILIAIEWFIIVFSSNISHYVRNGTLHIVLYPHIGNNNLFE